jgi:hypothetical protein
VSNLSLNIYVTENKHLNQIEKAVSGEHQGNKANGQLIENIHHQGLRAVFKFRVCTRL